ncbi:MAG TPA: DUF523 domain-containing protein [Peptococcaceae bacterium]|nr:MAG: hypothetical protein XD50_0260 [Clostridia bacterium 41_269]HBT19969.1 DUF523 domain-containing protein [Peptococcaceae bacterium]
MILISACLIGINCKYNGGNNALSFLDKLPKCIIPICPEQLGGLPTPRPQAEIVCGDGSDVLEGNAKVITKNGVDVTKNFIFGAEQTLKIAQFCGAKEAILKSHSPSCGSGFIYDGSFKGKLKKGDGVAAALLKKNGIKVITEKELFLNYNF